MPSKPDPVADYRHDATRKNNPPAALASQGHVREVPKQRYNYDPHLPPVLRFDDTGESDRLPELLEEATRRKLTAEEASSLAEALRNRQPWLEWTGKREKRLFEVDPVALHIHERVSAQAAIRVAARQDVQRGLWADPEQDYHEAVQFYKYDVEWSNRLILGDSLAVMNSLAKREDMTGKVQMIYVDPPYGINFRSNFQPFVRNRNVRDRDADLTREPEMVKAYRDTWTLGVHTYLAYLRDRLTVARDLLTDSGSIFVQIGDENVHRVREVMDEVYGSDNFIGLIVLKKTSAPTDKFIPTVSDFIIWYAKAKPHCKYRQLNLRKDVGEVGASQYVWVEDNLGFERRLSNEERRFPHTIPPNEKIFAASDASSSHEYSLGKIPIAFRGASYTPRNRYWSTTPEGMIRARESGRLITSGTTLFYKRYLTDFPVMALTNIWTDTSSSFGERTYTVQTTAKTVERCIQMTTDPGDLVLDPTCGSGTTAYVAEQWGRRWITIDTSRVALALARQRILTARFDYYKTADGSNTVGEESFKYKTVPHITLRSIAQNVALDPIFTRWEPILDEKLAALNDALGWVDDDTRSTLLAKLDAKRKRRGLENRVTDADERRWKLPKDRWEHWEVPFDADPDYPALLKERLKAYREAWRAKMDEVNACIAASADQEVLVDQPEVERGITRVSGPFTVEAVQPAEESLDGESPIGGAPGYLDTFSGDGAFNTDEPHNAESFRDTIIRLLRNDGVRFQGNGVARFTRLEPLSDGNILHAEGEWEPALGNDRGSGDPDNPRQVAVSVGPQYGPVTAKQVEDSMRTAFTRGYDALVFAGFSFDGAAQAAIEADPNPHVRMHMAHISPDVSMHDLLKESRDSQLFTVSGLPRTKLIELAPDSERGPDGGEYVVEMEGVDIYDPVSNTIVSQNANRVAAWFLDSDYDGRTFCISQAFFPDSNAWDRLKRSLKSVVDADAFEAFSGTKSLPFPAGENRRVAVKVIDPRGNEVMKIHSLEGEIYGDHNATYDSRRPL